jgi:hypothetical protein
MMPASTGKNGTLVSHEVRAFSIPTAAKRVEGRGIVLLRRPVVGGIQISEFSLGFFPARCEFSASAVLVNIAACRSAVRPLDVGVRDAFLQAVAAALANCTDISPGTVYRVVAETQRKFFDPPDLWQTSRSRAYP